jgi:aspartate aminotransferase
LNEGDEVIILAPYWVSYPDMVLLAGGSPVIVNTDEKNGYAPEPEALARALTSKTRAIVINSPSNPTGAVFSNAVLRGIAEVVGKHDCLIVSDDIYEKLLYRPEPFANIANVAPDLFDRVVVINGMSKAYAMTGWRLGYAAGPKEIIAAMQLVQDQSTSNTSSISQKAAVAALQGPKQSTDQMVQEYKVRRDIIVAGLNAIEGVTCHRPDGAFYVFPRIQKLLERKYKGEKLAGSVRVSDILLDDFRVGVVPGLPFGAEGHLRLSFATSRETIEKGLSRIRQFVASLS